MKYVIFTIILAILKESNTISPDIRKYDQYMKDFEVTGRQIKHQAMDEKMDGSVIKRESPHEESSFEQTWNREVEEKFKTFHPDLDALATKPWPIAENLTSESLKKLCNDVMIDRSPPWEPSMQWVKAYIPPEEDKLKERVVKYAEVLFQEGRKNMTVVRCVYKWFDFFLTEGDHENVFKLDHDLVDKVWLFDLGPFRIHH